MNKHFLFVFAFLSMLTVANAQLNQNPCKFLGNITTSYNWQEQADAKETNEKYYQLWDQITSENGSKWGSIHTGRGQFNWTNADRAYNYAKEHGLKVDYKSDPSNSAASSTARLSSQTIALRKGLPSASTIIKVSACPVTASERI